MALQIAALWQRRNFFLLPLLPVAVLFRLLAALRATLYKQGWLKRQRLPVPVVVVGNISVGGTGKTPLTLYLAQQLCLAGFRPGIISRGYGGNALNPQQVQQDDPASLVGDEPLLLARRAGCPVFIGRLRHQAGLALLTQYPECNVILCDDGLQHYQLERDIEIAVIDGQRGLGNGWPLPAGSLREPPSRLSQVDAVIVNGELKQTIPPHPSRFQMSLDANQAYQLINPANKQPLAAFSGQNVAALAGIGHPPRFFFVLEQAGMLVDPHPFPDHHAYTADELTAIKAGTLLVTEKDAVKLAPFNDARIWVVPVSARLAPDLAAWLVDRLESSAKPTAAR
ncbi:tetraacyldisaccharide 4'-kinase [Parachitinimonas caeni]|uniref:Tetraacyldisaccharide 4'-kinase n=1 Tax=Parachitinimonas caeni TaxID=3031301 RepID=A0ABT7DU05_9NEIS|nr:tetraacyldisaccharide 4'-kinase [Parachitinimonas caeni]MDK2123560.1 tetraacyldisaccharide 4'-kinase [Parachitinimonas caeni]